MARTYTQMTPQQWEGNSGADMPGIGLIRSESMDATNDPRLFTTNVLLKRMGAFHTIAVSAVLMANLSLKQMLSMEGPGEKLSLVQYLALLFLCMSFILNFTTVIVIVIQLYHMTRLSTAGPTGFEVAKSYYINSNITSLRHCGARAFFYCIPVFMVSVACTVYVKLGDQPTHSLPVCAVIVLCSLCILVINKKHKDVFVEKYQMASMHSAPLMNHLATFSQGSNYNNLV